MRNNSFHTKFLLFSSILTLPPLAVLIARSFRFTEEIYPPDGNEAIPSLMTSDLYYGLIWLSIFTLTILGASLGLWVSFFIRANNLHNEHHRALSRADVENNLFTVFTIFSVILGVVTSSIFVGGFISGSIFPNFNPDNFDFNADFKIKDLGKLFIWGFVSGFSERLIPNFMERMAEQFSTSSTEN